MVTIKTNYHNRITTPDEQRLYDHLLGCVALECPEQVIDRFYSLFISGVGYIDRDIVAVLDRILDSPDVEQYFRYVLNRCCHILINRWQGQPQLQQAIPGMIALFNEIPQGRITELSRGRSVRRLRQIVHEFLQTEQYHSLRRLARVLEARHEARQRSFDIIAASQPLGRLIDRYPYLYEHCLLTEDSDLEHQHHIRRIQAEAQHKFEVDLSHYVTHRVRQTQLRRQGIVLPQNAVRPINNPTLLNDRELVDSLRHFSTIPLGQATYQDIAERFVSSSCQSVTFGAFKENLYDYITLGVDPSYGRQQFNKLLDHQLRDTFPESNSKPLNDFLMVRTCSRLFNFLVIDSAADRQHFLFIDLINNLGPILTTGLLLRILLICRKVKPYLERRFSLLFNHYERATQETVDWLVKVLENMNIALSLNFGEVDFSHALLG